MLLHRLKKVHQIVDALPDFCFVSRWSVKSFFGFEFEPISPNGHFAVMRIHLLTPINQSRHALAWKRAAIAHCQMGEIGSGFAQPKRQLTITSTIVTMAWRTIAGESSLR